MAQPFRDDRSFISAVVEMVEELRQAILAMRDDAERSKHVKKLLEDSEMVFGAWPDPDAVSGVGIQIIKGAGIMPPLVGFDKA